MMADDLAAMVYTLESCLEACESALDSGDTKTALLCTRAARAAVAAVTVVAEASPDDFALDTPVGTTDPATCGHPETFDLPGQIMCASCGASKVGDGWAVL
jgi:hypothetical protein